eukprot:1647546-Prymnesium_polylepis.2
MRQRRIARTAARRGSATGEGPTPWGVPSQGTPGLGGDAPPPWGPPRGPAIPGCGLARRTS